MEYVYEHDAKMISQMHEERRVRLARTYANGHADMVALRTMVAKSVTFLGDMLIRTGQWLMSGDIRRQEQQLQPLRVRSEGNN